MKRIPPRLAWAIRAILSDQPGPVVETIEAAGVLTPEQRRHFARDQQGNLPGESPADLRQARINARFLSPTGLFKDPSDAEVASALQGIIDRAYAGHVGDAETCPHPNCRSRATRDAEVLARRADEEARYGLSPIEPRGDRPERDQ